jgi:hypothetical protein
MLRKLDIVVTDTRKADFNPRDIEQDLNRLIGDELSVASLRNVLLLKKLTSN